MNYWDSSLRSARVNELLKVAKYSDYIRCDMAFLALNDVMGQNWGSQLSFWGYSRPSTEFWSDAIRTVKQQYNVLFLAEVYNPNQQRMIDVGFDFVYEKTLYDHLAGGNLDDIRGYITGTSLNFHQHGAHFVENHDEPRAASFFGSAIRADAANAVSMTLPGLRFYFMGQENGDKNKLDVHLRRGTPEPVNTGVNAYYNVLWKALSLDITKYGSWNYRNAQGTGDSWRFLTWEWVYNGHKVLAVINYSDGEGAAYVVCPLAQPENGNDTINLTELLTGTVYPRSAKQMSSQGLMVVLGAWSVQMFQYN
uniref:Glycosyl hydrolase family 13 catalytic domain-containing protein n=1 Tax=Arcella intermedia TaxID=1963864 RepID=A0A6B2LAG2_9EUKA